MEDTFSHDSLAFSIFNNKHILIFSVKKITASFILKYVDK